LSRLSMSIVMLLALVWEVSKCKRCLNARRPSDIILLTITKAP
jgi:hypothetical protein